MLSRYKLLLIDVDGTLVENNPHALPSPRVTAAVKSAQEYVHVALATGRPFYLAKAVVHQLNLRGLSIFNGGAEIIDVTTGTVLHRQVLSIDTLRELVTVALPFGYSIYLHDDPNGMPLHKPEDVTIQSAQLLIQGVKKTDVVELIDRLATVKHAARSYEVNYSPQSSVVFSTQSWQGNDLLDIHIVHEHGTKKYGVERLLQIMNIPKEATMAIGDGENDFPLLAAAGFKIAMGNAPGEIKGMADYIAPPLAEDGVAEAIQNCILGGHQSADIR
jgi:Cof subfamily protein (haloacid dehalogenase superfamily)